MRPPSLDGCVCPEGHVAPAGQVRISPGPGLWAQRRMKQSLGRSQLRHRQGSEQSLGPNSPSLQRAGALSASESSTVFPVFLLIYLFWPNPVPRNFSSFEQTIHHEDKWAKSQSSEKQSSYQKRSILQRLQMAVKFCILCSLPKHFLFNTSVFQ